MKTTITSKTAFLLVASLFMMWGIANNMNDTLLAAFKRIMSMSDLQTSLVQFAFYGAYFCMALPAALFITRHSYKSGIILGLALYAAGTMLFYPAGNAASYGFFLFAIYVMACGCSILETTANPYILSMGSRETATRRLNLAQTLNPLGAICGILISRHFILSELQDADAAQRAGMSAADLAAMQHHELTAISSTYLLIGCLLIALLVLIAVILPGRLSKSSGLPGSSELSESSVSSELSESSEQSEHHSILRRLWQNRTYRQGVVAQFFYVGVQTGVWSFTIRLAMQELGIHEKEASMIFLCSIIAFTLFRFLFTWLMKYVRPARLLAGNSVAAIMLSLTVVFATGWTAVAALVAISACMSLMFPTIYGMALEEVETDDAKLASSGLIMAILGGAIITPLQAFISDRTGISASFCIPALCFLIILTYSLSTHSNDN